MCWLRLAMFVDLLVMFWQCLVMFWQYVGDVSAISRLLSHLGLHGARAGAQTGTAGGARASMYAAVIEGCLVQSEATPWLLTNIPALWSALAAPVQIVIIIKWHACPGSYKEVYIIGK